MGRQECEVGRISLDPESGGAFATVFTEDYFDDSYQLLVAKHDDSALVYLLLKTGSGAGRPCDKL